MPERTGGMIALLPDVESARLLALAAPGAEHLDDLHLTLASLGDDVAGWTDEHCTEAIEPARTAAYLLGPCGRACSRTAPVPPIVLRGCRKDEHC
jgi:hypothetical protein